MKPSRPIYLDLLHIHQPLPAVISFLHRISGLLLFVSIPWLLTMFQASLSSAESFDAWKHSLGAKLALFLVLAAYAYHFYAGLRFLVLDLHWGTTLKSARLSARVVLGMTLLSCLLLGIWLW